VRVCVIGVEEERLRFCSLWVVCGVRVLCFRVLIPVGSLVGLLCVLCGFGLGFFVLVGFGSRGLVLVGFFLSFFGLFFLFPALRFLLYTAGVLRGA